MPTPPIPDSQLVGVAVYGDAGVELVRRLKAAGYEVHITGPRQAYLQPLVDNDGATRHGDVVALYRALGRRPLIWATGSPVQTAILADNLHQSHDWSALIVIDGTTYRQNADMLVARATWLQTRYKVRCVAVNTDDPTNLKFNGDPDAVARVEPVARAALDR